MPEVAKLYQSLGVESCLDGRYQEFRLQAPRDYDPNRVLPKDVFLKKDELDSLLSILFGNELEKLRQVWRLKPQSIDLAQSYGSPRWMHNNWLTAKILEQLIDGEPRPLDDVDPEVRKASHDIGRGESPFANSLFMLVPVTYLVIVGLVASAIAASEYSFFGWLIVAQMIWYLGRRITLSVKLSTYHEKRSLFYNEIAAIWQDLVAEPACFDSTQLARRLQRFDSALRLQIHSLLCLLPSTPAFLVATSDPKPPPRCPSETV